MLYIHFQPFNKPAHINLYMVILDGIYVKLKYSRK